MCDASTIIGGLFSLASSAMSARQESKASEERDRIILQAMNDSSGKQTKINQEVRDEAKRYDTKAQRQDIGREKQTIVREQTAALDAARSAVPNAGATGRVSKDYLDAKAAADMKRMAETGALVDSWARMQAPGKVGVNNDINFGLSASDVTRLANNAATDGRLAGGFASQVTAKPSITGGILAGAGSAISSGALGDLVAGMRRPASLKFDMSKMQPIPGGSMYWG